MRSKPMKCKGCGRRMFRPRSDVLTCIKCLTEDAELLGADRPAVPMMLECIACRRKGQPMWLPGAPVCLSCVESIDDHPAPLVHAHLRSVLVDRESGSAPVKPVKTPVSRTVPPTPEHRAKAERFADEAGLSTSMKAEYMRDPWIYRAVEGDPDPKVVFVDEWKKRFLKRHEEAA